MGHPTVTDGVAPGLVGWRIPPFGVGLGLLLDRHHWTIGTYAIVPFSASGAIITWKLWGARPAATSR